MEVLFPILSERLRRSYSAGDVRSSILSLEHDNGVHVRAGRVLVCPAVETPLPLGRAVLVRPQKVEAGELVKVEAMADLFRVLMLILAVSIHDSGV